MNLQTATTILAVARLECFPERHIEDHAVPARNLAAAIIAAGGEDDQLIASAVRIAAARCCEFQHLGTKAASIAITQATNLLAIASE